MNFVRCVCLCFLLFSNPFFHPKLTAANLPPGFAEVQVASGLDPVAMALAPDGRLFVAEKFGRVLLVENGQLLPDPFLEIEVDNFNERGLSGIAVDPGFEQNHFIYLYYTVKGAGRNRVSRFTADGNFVQPGSEVILLELDPLNGPHHNAGAMVFGSDGKLYIAAGDGTSLSNSQNLSTLLGKILRINPDGSIPEDNPFYSSLSGKYRAIWATGLRNPFAMTVQPGTGRIFATDVGSDKFEEINEILKGRNYGWSLVEGKLAGQTPPAGYCDPLLAYGRFDGCAATALAFYQPAEAMFPQEYFGKLFFADYCPSRIQTLDLATGEVETFATGGNRPIGLLTAPDGTMYYLARGGLGGGSAQDNTASSNGQLWRIFYTGSNAPFVSVHPQPVLASVGESATFSVAASGAAPLHFQWQRGSVDIPGATGQEFFFQNASLADSGSLFRCIVANADGADTSQAALLQVTASQRPMAAIFEPPEGALYRAGDLLVFSGEADDAEEGVLPPSALRWKIDFVHHTHSHPALGPLSGIEGDTFPIPQSGEVDDHVFYRITLTATDQSGLSSTVVRQVLPLKTQFFLQTQPPGFPLTVDGQPVETPDAVSSVAGVFHEVTAPLSHFAGDSLYLFINWASGEAGNRLVFAAPDEASTLTAVYEASQRLGEGTGLRASYFNDEGSDLEFETPADLSRLDSVVHFDWGAGSPAAGLIDTDFFLVRWEGFVKPFLDDTCRFHLASDDGVRLWVGGQLLIDAWQEQPPTERTGSAWLQGGVQQPVVLEYFEKKGGALCQLLWSSARIGRSVVPRSQLFPKMSGGSFELNRLLVKTFPNPVAEKLRLEFESESGKVLRLELFNSLGQALLSQEHEVRRGFSSLALDVRDLAGGVCFLKISGSADARTIRIFKK